MAFVNEQYIEEVLRKMGYTEQLTAHELTAMRQNPAIVWAIKHLEKREQLDPAAVALYEDAEASGIISQDSFNVSAVMLQSVQLMSLKQREVWLPEATADDLQPVLDVQDEQLSALMRGRDQLTRTKEVLDRNRIEEDSCAPGHAFLLRNTSKTANAARAAAEEQSSTLERHVADLKEAISEMQALLQNKPSRWLLCTADMEQLNTLDQSLSAEQNRLAELITNKDTKQVPSNGGKRRTQRSGLGSHHQERLLRGLTLDEQMSLHTQLELLRRGNQLGEMQHANLKARAAALQAQLQMLQQACSAPAPPAPHEHATYVAQLRDLTSRSAEVLEALRSEVQAAADMADTDVLLGKLKLEGLRRQVEHSRLLKVIDSILAASSRSRLLAEAQRDEVQGLSLAQQKLLKLVQQLAALKAAAEQRVRAYSGKAADAQPRANVAPGDSYLQGLPNILGSKQLTVPASIAILQQRLGSNGSTVASAGISTPARRQHTPPPQHQQQHTPQVPASPGYLPVQSVCASVAAVADAASAAAQQLQAFAGPQLEAHSKQLLDASSLLHSQVFARPSDQQLTLTDPQLQQAFADISDTTDAVTAAISTAQQQHARYTKELNSRYGAQEERAVLRMMMEDGGQLVELVSGLEAQAARLEAQQAYA